MLRARPVARQRWVEHLADGNQIAFASAPLAELAAVRHATPATRIVAGVPMALAQAVVLSVMAPILPALLKVKAARRRIVTAGGHASTVPSKAPFQSRVWVSGRRGKQTAAAQLESGEGYTLAAEIAVLAIEAYQTQRPRPGAHTPATACGGTSLVGSAALKFGAPGRRQRANRSSRVSSSRRTPPSDDATRCYGVDLKFEVCLRANGEPPHVAIVIACRLRSPERRRAQSSGA
jgi:hypothetical protein